MSRTSLDASDENGKVVEDFTRFIADLRQRRGVGAASITSRRRVSGIFDEDDSTRSDIANRAGRKQAIRMKTSSSSLFSSESHSRRLSSESASSSTRASLELGDTSDAVSRKNSARRGKLVPRGSRPNDRSSSANTLAASNHESSRPLSLTPSEDHSSRRSARSRSGSDVSSPSVEAASSSHQFGLNSTYLAQTLSKRRRRSRTSVAGTDDGDDSDAMYCTCCCDKPDCKRARRAASEWADMQEDLRLAAEIGQALLTRHDDAIAMHAKAESEYFAQRDALMSKLTSSIKESSSLQRQLAQCNLNLEAADSSNRTLLHELDETRGALAKLRRDHAKCALTASRAEKIAQELDDVKQENIAARKREEASASLAKRVGRRNEELVDQLKQKVEELEQLSRRQKVADLGEEALEQARRRLKLGEEAVTGQRNASQSAAETQEEAYEQLLQKFLQEKQSFEQENRYLRDMLEAKTEEANVLKEAQLHRSFAKNHQRSLSLAGSAGLPSPTTPAECSPKLDTDEDHHDQAQAEPKNGLSLSEELSTAATSSKQAEAGAEGPALLVSPPSRNSDLPALALSPKIASPETKDQGKSTQSNANARADSSFRATSIHSRDEAVQSASHSRENSSSIHRDSSTSRRGSMLQRKASLLARDRDSRTTQLGNLLDSVQRLFTRLETADVDTLSRRLQKQHLTGDVGHLARTTVNAIMRDVEGLREHFRRLIEQEARNAARDEASSNASSGKPDVQSESLLARREFFTLIKTFKDLFVEIGRLRKCINEIHLQPGQAAKLLQEHLGLAPVEEKGLIAGAAWLSKMWAGASAPISATANAVVTVAGKGSDSSTNPSVSPAPSSLRPSGALRRTTPRAEPSVVSTAATAVAATGASPDPSAEQMSSTVPAEPLARLRPNPNLGRKSLTRVQSRNLSGLFAGAADISAGWDAISKKEISQDNSSPQARLRAGLLPNRGPAQRPLSRIVDDDEVHHGRNGDEGDYRGALLERTLRPRGLSDSSIHSTFLAHEDASQPGASAQPAIASRPSPVSRLITASTLALQVSSSGAHATARAIGRDDDTESPTMSEGSASNTLSTAPATSSSNPSSAASKAMSFFPSLASLQPSGLGIGNPRSISSASRAPSTSSVTTGVTSLSASPAHADGFVSRSPKSRDGASASRIPSDPKRRHARKSSVSKDEQDVLSQSFAYSRMQRNNF